MGKAPAKSEPVQNVRYTYPYYMLKPCLKLGGVVRDGGGERVGVPKSVIAKDLEMDKGSSAFGQIVASAKTFSIVDGTKELRLTDLGRDYFLPTTDSARRLAELGFIEAPTAFKFLIEKFDGSRIPNSEMLANLVGRQCGLPESWRVRVAQMFVSIAQDIGIVDAGGYLRFDAAKHEASSGIDSRHTQPNSSDTSTTPQHPDPSVFVGRPLPRDAGTTSNESSQNRQAYPVLRPIAPGTNVWSFDEMNKTVRVETSPALPHSLWMRLKKYVELIEPTMENTEGPQSGGNT